MIPLAWDTETALIRPACLAPPLACVTWQRPGADAQIIHARDVEPLLRAWLEDPETLLVGQNIAYDLAVVGQQFPDLLPLIFAAYDADRVTDTMIRQQLLDIASGTYRGRIGERGRWIEYRYDLESLAKRCAGMVLQKDAWRLSYGSFVDVPLDEWPARARELQAQAAERIAAIGDPGEDRALKKELDGLHAMVDGDPSRCVTYPLDDARATLAVYLAQEQHAQWLDDQYRQARAAFWLHLSSAWGLRTDAEGVAKLRAETEAQLAEIEGELTEAGLLRAPPADCPPELLAVLAARRAAGESARALAKDYGREALRWVRELDAAGSRDTDAAARRMVTVCTEEGIPLRRTPAHSDACGDAECHVCLDSDACRASGDPILAAYAEASELKKVLANDIPALERGVLYPVHTRYGLAETGRTTSSGPNIQNLRRKAGIREAFVPRPGHVFFQADYPQLELYTLAQCCVSWLGRSKLADALNAGLDPHLAMAASILGMTYDEALANKKRPDVDAARQTAKVANFGFPGGLGVDKLILFAKKTYGVSLTRIEALRLKEQYFAAWPEMPEYFARINALCDTADGRAVVETLWTKRHRGGASYCAASNNGFQALGVDCAKRAGWLIAKAGYVDVDSPLFGSRIVAFVHDEFIGECVEAQGHEAAHELARLMVAGTAEYLPDVPIPLSRMEPLLMRRWSKKAAPVLDGAGRLVPWG